MDIVSVVKEHPLPIVGGAILLLILVSMRGGSSTSGNSAGIAAAVESQRIATAGNVQIAGINAQAATARGAQGVDAYKTQITENGKQAVARTSLMQNLFSTQIGASTALAVDTNKNLTTRLVAGLNHQDNQTQMADALTLGQYTTDAGVKVAMERLSTDIKVNNSNNDAKLNALSQVNATSLSALGMQIASHKYDTDVTAANLPAIMQHSENAQKIAGANAQSLAQIQGNYAQIIAGLNTEAARKTASANASSTDASTGASWVSTAANLFAMFA